MPTHTRKLLLLAALCWVVPVSAHQPSLSSKQLKEGPSCPIARAKMLAAAQSAPSGAKTKTVIFVSRNDSIREGSIYGASRAFQP
jgi:hypothetical protein